MTTRPHACSSWDMHTAERVGGRDHGHYEKHTSTPKQDLMPYVHLGLFAGMCLSQGEYVVNIWVSVDYGNED